ncbi:hypothetical protein [Streptomyces sp. NPDC048252]|uniref:hypothetical protein n=1 Tax=Streptomyces sp. NPDC048252 TaxID=3154612 RepID=UPI00344727FA
MADRWDVPPVGPGAAPEKWLWRVGFVGLVIGIPGVAVGYFEGFDDDTAAGAFAWIMTFFGCLLVGVTAWVGVLCRLDPESRRERHRGTAARGSRQAPLAASDLTYKSLLSAAVRSTAEVVPQPPAAVIDNRRLVWWRNRDLLAAFGLPSIAAWTVFTALAGTAGVLHIVGGPDRGYFFLVLSVCGLAAWRASRMFTVRFVPSPCSFRGSKAHRYGLDTPWPHST